MVSLPNHTFPGQASSSKQLTSICAHFFARHWQLPFLNQQKEENDQRKYFMINLYTRMLPDLEGTEPETSWSPVQHASDWATEVSSSVYSTLNVTYSQKIRHWLCMIFFLFLHIKDTHQNCLGELSLTEPKQTKYWSEQIPYWKANYHTYPYKHTVKQFCSLQITFRLLLYKGICCGYPLDLLMQFQWVPTTYAFIKTIRKKKQKNTKTLHKHKLIFFFFFNVYP